MLDPASGRWTTEPDLSNFPPMRRDPLLWADVDLTSATDHDLSKVERDLNLHPLAVEDALNPRQRPKLESYPEHMFLVLHQLDEHAGQLEASQIACFIGKNFVLTVHDAADRLLAEARKRWDGVRNDAEKRSAAHLVHLLLDVIVDDYQAIADDIEDKTEALEEVVLENTLAPVQRRLYELKQHVSRMRRYSIPLHRALDVVLGSGGDGFFPEDVRQQLNDVNDHVMRIADQVRSMEDLSAGILDLSRQAQADSLNEINKKLSGWAAIFGVSAIIAGIYGMNYVLVPSIHGVAGFWFAIALMIGSAIGMYLYFSKKGWL